MKTALSLAASPDTILVTHATRVLGNNAVRLLERAGKRVIALARSPEQAARVLAGSTARVVCLEPGDSEQLAMLLSEADAVIDAVQKPSRETRTATLDLLRIADARGVRRFVRLGAPLDAATRERAAQLSLAVIELHTGWVFGPYDAEPPSSAANFVIDLIKRRLPLAPPGGVCVVDARDAAFAASVALELADDGARYDVAGLYHTSSELLTILGRVSGVRPPRFAPPYAVARALAATQQRLARIFGRPSGLDDETLQMLNEARPISSAKAECELDAHFRPFAETARDTVHWLLHAGYVHTAELGVDLEADIARASTLPMERRP
ncbi:MAG: NAD(P)H-binding protein [Myxococcales bacterium]|nr:NAD(P)H-binding protein [Myxococcales bacterium]